ncbi:histidine phosphatase family protein [Dysgonomonas sp. 25]|uniref:histidine phosphatase family protein n=1 Tax=Dysgonomonas sp. 25 TaxID=2302933 RepID=UPI0013D2B4BB|nr:histidine phosphatase family protein [Dysgonomonas sp. 25]NDV69233.1 histidine phosphatase family protein [Dysgonomonas sp. 25]
MSTITLYIVRHGQTMMNALDRVQGWCDSPLTKEGIEVARHLGYGFDEKGIHFRSAYCSDLRRTRQTAQIILGAKGEGDIPLAECAGFREACFGSYESGANATMWKEAALYLQFTSSEAMYRAVMERRISSGDVLDAVKTLDTMDMAEGFSEVEARTQETLLEIAQAETLKGEGNILVVAHGMSILCLLYNLGGKALLNGHLENAAVCKVTYEDGRFTVHSMGDMSYLAAGCK